MESVGKQLLRLFWIFISLAIESSVGYAIWVVTAFLNAERVHDKLMALGDSREMTMLERGWIWAGWAPFTLWILAFAWFQVRVAKDMVSQKRGR